MPSGIEIRCWRCLTGQVGPWGDIRRSTHADGPVQVSLTGRMPAPTSCRAAWIHAFHQQQGKAKPTRPSLACLHTAACHLQQGVRRIPIASCPTDRLSGKLPGKSAVADSIGRVQIDEALDRLREILAARGL